MKENMGGKNYNSLECYVRTRHTPIKDKCMLTHHWNFPNNGSGTKTFRKHSTTWACIYLIQNNSQKLVSGKKTFNTQIYANSECCIKRQVPVKPHQNLSRNGFGTKAWRKHYYSDMQLLLTE